MWIFLHDTMLSIVEDTTSSGKNLLVRARVNGDIQKIFPSARILWTPLNDYHFRTILPREEVGAAISREVVAVSYPNFKGFVSKASPARAAVYHDVWDCGQRGLSQLDSGGGWKCDRPKALQKRAKGTRKPPAR